MKLLIIIPVLINYPVSAVCVQNNGASGHAKRAGLSVNCNFFWLYSGL